MFGRRFAVVTFVAVCLSAAPVSSAAPSPSAQGAREDRTSYRSNRVLTNVIIYGSIGAIAGALGTLRKRNPSDSIGRDDESAGR